jgi:hypothetical protein
VGVGYSYVRYRVGGTSIATTNTAGEYPKGGYVSYSFSTPWRLDVTAEGSIGSGSRAHAFTGPGGTVVFENPITAWAVVMGPSVSFRRSARASPFVRAMVGLGGSLVACVQGGGGIDFRVNERVRIRAGTDIRQAMLRFGADAELADDEASALLVTQVGMVFALWK